MSDMLPVIQPKCDELTGDDLIAGPRTITITAAKVQHGTERPVTLGFEGDGGKPFKPCKTMSKLLAFAWGPSSQEFIGKSLTVYRDPDVKWGGLKVGGVRISHMSHIERDFVVALTETRGVKKPVSIKMLVVDKSLPKADKAAAGVRTLVARINHVDPKNLANIVDDPVVIKQLTWLSENRPELAQEVKAAILAHGSDIALTPWFGDADYSDVNNDTPANHPARAKAHELIAKAAALKPGDVAGYNVLTNDAIEHVDAMPEYLQAEVRAAFETALARIEEN